MSYDMSFQNRIQTRKNVNDQQVLSHFEDPRALKLWSCADTCSVHFLRLLMNRREQKLALINKSLLQPIPQPAPQRARSPPGNTGMIWQGD